MYKIGFLVKKKTKHLLNAECELFTIHIKYKYVTVLWWVVILEAVHMSVIL